MTNSINSEPAAEPLENLVSLAERQFRRTNHRKYQTKPDATGKSKNTPKRIVCSNTSPRPAPGQITFDRRELNEILRIYGFRVAAGEWHDYAIDHLKDRAIFSIFRKNGEIALFRIEKNPKLATKQGAYSVITIAGMIIKRGPDLRQVLRVFDKKPKLEILTS
jgi:hypothetical protein